MGDFDFSFTYNFDALDSVKLRQKEGITQQEMIQVIEKDSFRLRTEESPVPGDAVWIKTEYSINRRIILVAFICDGDTIFFIGAKVADQIEVDLYYCGQ